MSVSLQPRWFLTEFSSTDVAGQRVAITKSPFRIGRLPELPFQVEDGTVSKVHAELVASPENLLVRDLQSTNGTFVNGQRVEEARLKAGDLVQFANSIFRVSTEEPRSAILNTVTDAIPDVPHTLLQFDRLMTERAVTPHYQPIVSIEDNRIIGYESLARSQIEGLESPYQMFQTAAQLDQEIELSRMLRSTGLIQSQRLPGRPAIFLNTHPRELTDAGLIESLRQLRELLPGQLLVLEIHESAVTDLDAMKRLHESLRMMDIKLAYDDFGAGQARLIELSEVPPDYLKFDMRLIRDIHRASDQRTRVLRTLVSLVRDIGVAALAEGIECLEEALTCHQIGFQYAQGYFFGRPAAAP